uniref:uncharacterized protein LOC100184652 n=1 Tax=Ciona intestinalis TaxID=7719 RepID=UPI000180B859|nr:uncharacterized protein LOC100184652 [Ciona intestinalis]|eukprot:XP_002119340.3 uncharacterized protein LOC100184652 [Ciona intestinalis]
MFSRGILFASVLLLCGSVNANSAKFAQLGKIYGFSSARSIYQKWLGSDLSAIETASEAKKLCVPFCNTTTGAEQIPKILAYAQANFGSDCAGVTAEADGFSVVQCLMSTRVIDAYLSEIVPDSASAASTGGVSLDFSSIFSSLTSSSSGSADKDRAVTALKSVIDVEFAIDGTETMNWAMSIFDITEDLLKENSDDLDIFLSLVEDYAKGLKAAMAEHESWRVQYLNFVRLVFKSVKIDPKTDEWVDQQFAHFGNTLQQVQSCSPSAMTTLGLLIDMNLNSLETMSNMNNNQDFATTRAQWTIFSSFIEQSMADMCQAEIVEEEVLAPPPEEENLSAVDSLVNDIMSGIMLV